MKKETRVLFSPFIAAACVGIGQHVGPGVAGGASLVAHFGRFGLLGFITPFISFTIASLVVYFCVEYSRVYSLESYAEYADKLGGKFSGIFKLAFDFCFLVSFVVAGGNCLSGFGALYNQFTGVNQWIPILILLALCIFLCMYGANLIAKSSTVMVYIIVVLLIIICVTTLAIGDHDFAASAELSMAKITSDSSTIGSAIYKGFIYGFTQSSGLLCCIPLATTLKSKAEAKKMAWCYWAGNIFVILVQMLTLFGFTYKIDISKESMPVLTILDGMGSGVSVLRVIYVMIVSLAIITSVVSLTFAAISRLGKYVKIQNIRVRNTVISGVGYIVLLGISNLGLLWLANQGNAIAGWLQIPVYVLPALFIVPFALKKAEAERK